MKKIFSLLLVVAMLAACVLTFASCGDGEPAATTTPTTTPVTGGQTDFERITANGKFICGYTVYEPMNFWDANGDLKADTVGEGQLVGFDTELARAVAAKLDLEVEFVEIDWGQKYMELSSYTIDCIWNGFTSNTADTDGIQRADKVDFSYAYLDNAQCVVVNTNRLSSITSAASLAGLVGAVEEGSAGEAYAKTVTDADNVITKTSQMDTFAELSLGTVDFVVVDVLLANSIVGQGDFANLAKATAVEIDNEVYSIGCRKGGDFDEKINEALVALLNDGTLEALATKYNVHITDSLMAMKTAD